MMKRRLAQCAVALGAWCVLVAVIAGPATAEEKPASKGPAKITYDEHIVPIFREKCFACHNSDKTEGGLNLTTYSSLMTGGGSGEVINPGEPGDSYLFNLVTHDSEPFMPPKADKIPAAMITTLKDWIAGGALENNGSQPRTSNKPKVDLALTTSSMGKPEGPPPMPGKLSLEPLVRTQRANAVTALAASPWAPLLAVSGQKQVLLYNTDTLDLVGILPFPEGVPHVLKFSRNGKLLLAGGGHASHSGRVVVWSVESGERLFEVGNELDAVLAADINADQTLIALGGPSKVVRIFSTRDGELLHEIRKHTDWITALEFSPDGVLLATGDRSGGLFVWEGRTAREYLTLNGHANMITDTSWRLDANMLASSSEDGTVRLWELEEGAAVKNWKAESSVQCVDYARDGRLATCGRENAPKLWQGDGAAIKTLPNVGDVAMKVVFSHDDKKLFCGNWKGEILVFNAADGTPAGTLTSNPPALADRIALAEKTLADARGKQQAADQTLAAAQQAVVAAKAKVEQVSKATAEFQAAVQKSEAALAAAQAASKEQQGKRKAAQDEIASATATLEKAKQEADAARKAFEAEPDNKDRAAVQEAAIKAVADHEAKLSLHQSAAAAAEKALAEADAAIPARQQEIAAAKQKLSASQAETKPAAEALQKAEEKAKADKAAADAARAAVKEAEALVQKWREAVAQSKAASEQVTSAK